MAEMGSPSRPQQSCYPDGGEAGDQLFPGVTMKEQAQGSCVTGPFSHPILPFYTHFPNQNEHKTGRTQLLWDISVCILLPVDPGHPMPLTWLVVQALGALNLEEGPEQKIQLQPNSLVLHAHWLCLSQQRKQGTSLNAISHTSVLLN